MSTIKNFGLAGVGSDIQFGKGGPRLVQSGGTFFARNAAGSALVTVDVADPTADTHAATRLFVNTGLGATRTGAGLGSDGSYTANGTANYISAATSLKSADNLLDFNLKVISLELDATQTGAGLGANGGYTANASGNYVNGATSLKSADNLLDTAIFNVQTELNTSQSAAGLNTDGTLPTWSSTNYVTGSASLRAAILALDTQIKTNADSVTALGNAFNYVGTVNGGASTGAALDLSTLAAGGKNPGDYYKVAVAGYFKVGAGTPFYANVGDGLVWNTSGDIDKIDNTDSTVAGTTNRISVTGAADTGFVVDIDSSYAGQNTITTLGTITTGTWSASAIGADKGGTGLTSYAAGDLIYASGTSTLTKLNKGTGNQILQMNSGGTAFVWTTTNAVTISYSSSNFSATNVGGILDEIHAQIASQTGDTIQSPDTKTAVQATDAAGVKMFDEISTTKTEFLRFTGTASAATLAAQGTGSNVNIVLAPKGTGSIDASAAKITNLANATGSSDALTYGQAKAIFTSYAKADITETTGNVAVGNVNGMVLRLIVNVTAPFASGSTVTVGYTGSQSALVTTSDVDMTTNGIYVINNVASINQTVAAYITASGGSTGTATVIAEYLSN